MAERARILLATDSADPSGLGQHMLTLARGLEPTFAVSLAFPAATAGFATPEGIAAFDADDPAALLAQTRPDLLHVHAGIGWEGHALAAAGAAAGLPVVRTEHLPWLVTDAVQAAAYRAAALSVTAFVAVSDAAAATLAPILGSVLGPEARLITIRNGIAPPAVTRSRSETRAALGIPDDRPVVLCAGRFTAQKDQRTLIRAIHRLGPGPLLLLAGDGPERAICEAEAAGSPDIVFLGRRADIPDLMRAADVFALPSLFEGLPLVVLEAMALGLPVVASEIASTLEALGPDHPFHAAPGDAVGLANALAAALAGPAAATAAAAARERFAKHFTARRMTDETAALYRTCLKVAGPHTSRGRRRFETRTKPMLKVGFIGAGGIAHRHLGVLETFEDAAVVGIADPDEARAAAAAERCGARPFAHHDEMIDNLALDALFICVPPFAHGAPECAALAAGLPFLVEKPLSLRGDLAVQIAAAVEAAGLVTAVGYHWRYLDTVDAARELLAANPAHLMSGYWLDQTPPPDWWRRTAGSGGQIVEQATHIIDLARFLAGDVTEVFGLAASRARTDFPDLDIPTASTATLRFASGAIANLSATCLLRWNHRVGLHVFADGLAMELTDRDLMVDVGRGRPVRGAEGDPVWRQDRAFLDAVKGGANLIRSPYADALRTHLVALAVASSARTGVPVRMEGLRADPQPPFRPAPAESADVA